MAFCDWLDQGTEAISEPSPALAAGVILTSGPSSVELFMVRRAPKLRFFGGFWAFPGGKVDDSDGDSATLAADKQIFAAARDLFEECGVLIARDSRVI